MIKVGVILDSDGHFSVADINNRPAMIKLLKKIDDGAYWTDLHEEALEECGCETEIDMLTIDYPFWWEFINSFTQRKTFEIVNYDSI